MSRKISILALGLILACHAFAEQDWKKPAELKIACSYDLYPYSFLDADGTVSGALVELWKLWSERCGVAVSFSVFSWSESIAAVLDGRTDVHSGLFDTDERRKFMDFSTLNQRTDSGLFVSDYFKPESIDELGSLPVGVIAGDYSAEYLHAKYPSLTLMEYPDTDALFDALKSHNLFVFADDVPRAFMQFSKHPDIQGKFRKISTLYSHDLNFGVKKGNAELLAFIKSGMQTISAKERAAINKRWIPYEQSDISFRSAIRFATVAAAISLFLFLAGSYFLLQRRVRVKTLALRETLAEKEKLIAELQEAVASVHTLNGLIPICAHCKKIRDDAGYWEQVEEYVRARADVRFSHGICPDCARKLYGDMFTEDEFNQMK